MNGGQRSFAVSLLHKLNIPVNPQNVRALVGWQQAEGGHWHNSAKYNPLNTTMPAPGAGNTGSQGNIKVYKDWGQGLDATARTLRNGRYGPILKALRSGSAEDVANAIGQTPWGTSSGLIQRVISGTPQQPVKADAPPTQSPKTVSRTVPGVDRSAERLAALTAYAQNSHVPGAAASLALGLVAANDTPARTVKRTTRAPDAPTSGPLLHVKSGTPTARSTSVGGVHQTAGLAGYPARDFFAPAGSAAVAPVTGKVVRLSGHDPKAGPVQGAGGPLGWSVYIQGDDGREYYLTHMGSRNVRVGQRVAQGQKIGTVANYHSYGRPDHIHMGVRG